MRGPAEVRHQTGQHRSKVRISTFRKLVYSGVVSFIVLGMLEAALWLAGVDPAFVEEDPYAGFSRHIPHFVKSRDAGDGQTVDLMTVAPNKRSVLNPQTFAARKPANVFRIVCLGGSTTYGRPFYDDTSFPGWLREFLAEVAPDQKWEVINAGGISYASYRVQGVMEELAQYEPDLFVVYSGQNEFLERRTYQGLSTPSLGSQTVSLVHRTRTATALRSVLDSLNVNRVHSQHRKAVLGEDTSSIPVTAVGPEGYQRDDELRDAIVCHFRSTLKQMADHAADSGKQIIFVVPCSNLSDFAPIRSQHRAGLTSDEEARWQKSFNRASELYEQSQFEKALEELVVAESIDDRFADLWFLKGRVLKSLDRVADANAGFRRARDEDVCPLRAIQPIVEAVREMESVTGQGVVDFEKAAEQQNGGLVTGEDFFHDHVHPTIEGNQLIATLIIREMQQRSLIQNDSDLSNAKIQEISDRVKGRLDRNLYARQLRLLAAMMGWLKQPDLARSQARLSLEWSGNTDTAMLEIAQLFMNNEASELAIEFLTEAIRINPHSLESHRRLAELKQRAGDLESAVQHWQEVVRLSPNEDGSLMQLAITLASLGRLTEAEERAVAAIRVAPSNPNHYNNLGLIVARQGRNSEALAHYQKCLSMDSTHVSAHFNAGLACEQVGDVNSAVQHFRKALMLNPRHEGSLERLKILQRKT